MSEQIIFIQAKRRILMQTMANGGLYVEDCAPWAIKEGCVRTDCPLRDLGVYEAHEDDYFTNCNPTGVIADVLLTIKATRGE